MDTKQLENIKKSLHKNPSVKHANDVIFNLAYDGGYYEAIRDYRMGEYAPQDIVEDQIKEYIAQDKDGYYSNDSLSDDEETLQDIQSYNDTIWFDFDTLKPVTAEDVIDIINDAIL